MTNFDFISKKDAPRLKNAAEKPFLTDQKLQVLAFQNAVVAPGWNGGVWNENKQHLPQTWLYWRGKLPLPQTQTAPESLHFWLDSEQETPPEILQKSEESVVFVGLFPGTWGHEITDNLKHLWFYFEEKYAHLKDLPWVFAMLWPQKSVSNNFLLFLKTLGLPQEKLRLITQPTQFARVFVPDECFFYDPEIGACRYTKEYARFFERLPQLPAPALNVQKIYLSRTHFDSQKDFNEIALENSFKNQGFTIIHPEQVSFLEQLAIFQHCQTFATTDGSIAHNLLFCKAGTTALICRKSRHFTIHQMPINALKNAQVFYIDAGFSPFADRSPQWWNGPFFMYESNALRRFFKLRPKFFPLFTFLRVHFKILQALPFKKCIFYLDHLFLAWSHPLRAQLQLGTRLKNFKKIWR